MRSFALLLLCLTTFTLQAQSWETKLTEKGSEFFRDFECANQALFISGVTEDYIGIIYASKNGGEKWEQLTIPFAYHNDLDLLSVVDENTIYVSDEEPEIFYVSKDGGTTWDSLPFIGPDGSFFVDDFHFETTTKGYAWNYDGELYTTSDGGNKWDSLTLPYKGAIWDYTFFDEDNFVVNLDSRLASTTDGGKTWKTFNYGPDFPEKMYFINASTGFGLSGRRMYATFDGGENWELKINYETRFRNLADITFYDEKRGIVTLDTKTYFSTQDGGVTWHEHETEPTYGGSLHKPHFLDASTVVTFADAGILPSDVGMLGNINFWPASVEDAESNSLNAFYYNQQIHFNIDPSESIMICITNISGKTHTQELAQNTTPYPLPSSFRAPGVYLCTIKTEDHLHSFKYIITEL
jgi:photosystem II stability/assembly factor-like uncharacterized protein